MKRLHNLPGAEVVLLPSGLCGQATICFSNIFPIFNQNMISISFSDYIIEMRFLFNCDLKQDLIKLWKIELPSSAPFSLWCFFKDICYSIINLIF